MILISNMDLCQSCIENTKRDSILNALIYTDVLNMDLCQSYMEKIQTVTVILYRMHGFMHTFT